MSVIEVKVHLIEQITFAPAIDFDYTENVSRENYLGLQLLESIWLP